jgi:hypothetical protein
MLNSADGVIFPTPIEPPRREIHSIFGLSSGKIVKNKAMLVREAVATIVSFSSSLSV